MPRGWKTGRAGHVAGGVRPVRRACERGILAVAGALDDRMDDRMKDRTIIWLTLGGIAFWILIVRPSIILSVYNSVAKLVRLALSQL